MYFEEPENLRQIMPSLIRFWIIYLVHISTKLKKSWPSHCTLNWNSFEISKFPKLFIDWKLRKKVLFLPWSSFYINRNFIRHAIEFNAISGKYHSNLLNKHEAQLSCLQLFSAETNSQPTYNVTHWKCTHKSILQLSFRCGIEIYENVKKAFVTKLWCCFINASKAHTWTHTNVHPHIHTRIHAIHT